jgi:hypothetical protein
MFKRERTSSPCVSSLKRADIRRNDSHFRRIGALGLIFLLPLENFAQTGILRSPWAKNLAPAVNRLARRGNPWRRSFPRIFEIRVFESDVTGAGKAMQLLGKISTLSCNACACAKAWKR